MTSAPTTGGMSPLKMPRTDEHRGRFQKGWRGGPGRPKGVPDRSRADLSQLIMDAATETGFIKLDENGKRVGSGEDGCKGYLKWLALHEPRTYAALLARILPYYVSTELPEDILSHEETLAELKARCLSIELIQYLRKAPTRLDDDEEEDPWGLRKKGVTLDMKPEAEQRSLAEAAKRGERVSAITARSARDTSDGTEEIELGKVIARLRRDQPRNADTMRICDALEHRLKPHRTAAAPA